MYVCKRNPCEIYLEHIPNIAKMSSVLYIYPCAVSTKAAYLP